MKKKTVTSDQITIIGVGASAGGLEALQEFLSQFPSHFHNIAIIIAQHLSPSYKSMLVQLLSRSTNLEVVEIKNGLSIESAKVYITPPDSELTIKGEKLFLTKPQVSTGPKPSIDVFFNSLAIEKKAEAIGVILSGTGSDGASGIREIKKAGGLTIVQEPQTAKYDGMPLAAIQTEHIDLVLSPDKIGEEILDYIKNPHSISIAESEKGEKKGDIVKLFNLLSKRTQTDFSEYKSSTFFRRLEKRLNTLKILDLNSYLKYVEEKPAELDALFQAILIGVTQFFRDSGAFDALEKIITGIISKKTPKEPIRIWVTGCASGEEAYSIAIIFFQQLKEKINNYNIQIFATDIDEKALSVARRGVYPKSAIEGLSSTIIGKYFKKVDENYYEISKSVRQLVLFSKHDVTVNPPFLKLDLISCRNLLIYFNTNLQKHVIPIFHYAMNPEGFLFLGKSETVGQFSDLFHTIDGKHKIFKRKGGQSLNAVRFTSIKTLRQSKSVIGQTKEKTRLTINEMIKETFYNTFEHPYIVINEDLDIQEIYGDVRIYIGLQEGSMNANILKLINKDLQIELRTIINNAIKDRIATKSKIKKFSFLNNEYFVRMQVKPLLYSQLSSELFILIFEKFDIEENILVNYSSSDGKEDPRIIELEQELQATKEHLQTYVEELETSNEELQALNEELQSANEELQSTNEELETSNEELQSTNEELQIAYAELKDAHENLEQKDKVLEENSANMKALLSTSFQKSVLINRDYQIDHFNSNYAEEVLKNYGKLPVKGDSILNYMPAESSKIFKNRTAKVFNGKELKFSESYIINGSNKRYEFHFIPSINIKGKVIGVAIHILDISAHYLAADKLVKECGMVELVFNSMAEPLIILNQDAQVLLANGRFFSQFNLTETETIGKNLFKLKKRKWNTPEIVKTFGGIIKSDLKTKEVRFVCNEESKATEDYKLVFNPVLQNDKKIIILFFINMKRRTS